MDPIRPDRDRVLELRDQHGMLKARDIATREALLAALDEAQDLDGLKRVIRALVERT